MRKTPDWCWACNVALKRYCFQVLATVHKLCVLVCVCVCVCVCVRVCYTWELSTKKQISGAVAVKLILLREKIVCGGRKKTKKKGSTSFSSALKTHETYWARSQVAITCLSRLIVKTAAGCYCHGQALGLNEVIPTCFCTMFWLKKYTKGPTFWKVKDSPWWLPKL